MYGRVGDFYTDDFHTFVNSETVGGMTEMIRIVDGLVLPDRAVGRHTASSHSMQMSIYLGVHFSISESVTLWLIISSSSSVFLILGIFAFLISYGKEMNWTSPNSSGYCMQTSIPTQLMKDWNNQADLMMVFSGENKLCN